MPRPRRPFRRILTKHSKEVEGLPELFDKLDSLAGVVELDEIINDVLMPAAEIGRDEIKSRAPVGDEPHSEGWEKIRDATFAAKGDPAKDRKGPSVIFGVNAHKAPQAIWIEYGFRHIGWPEKGKTLRNFPDQKFTVIPPQPFFRPARSFVRPLLAESIKTDLSALIDKAVK